MLTQQQKLNEELLLTAQLGRTEEMADLISSGAYVDYKDDDGYGYTVLFETVCKGDLDGTRLLLSQGANPNARNYRDETPLMFARMPELIKLLAEYNVNPLMRNIDGNTAYELFFYNKLQDLVDAYDDAGLQRPQPRANKPKRKSRR